MGLFEKCGTGRSCISFLKAVYTGTSSEVKVGEEGSKPFRVACGLRQVPVKCENGRGESKGRSKRTK